ncbi:MAG: C-GCAxxG-C-C family (seleno)protein [Clostridiales bacterium]
MKLQDLLAEGFGNQEDYNCAEKIIYGANRAYDLGLSEESCRLFAGFGGGMASGHICGAIVSSVGILSHLFVQNKAHQSEEIHRLEKEFLAKFEQYAQSTMCHDLKKKYFIKGEGCHDLLIQVGAILDELIIANKDKIVVDKEFDI